MMSSFLSTGARRGRTSVAAALVAASVGLATAMLGATPAQAATTPTITIPATFEGYGRISITGTARPGATVYLHEAAYKWRTAIRRTTEADVYYPEDKIEDVAATDGTFRLSRIVDSGFVYAVEADGLMSEVKTLRVTINTGLTISASGGTVTATGTASPGQPFLTVQLQRASGSTWTPVGSPAHSADEGVWSITASGQPNGSQTYRAVIFEDLPPEEGNGLLEGTSESRTVTITGGSTTPTTPTEPTPAKPTPTTPTEPTPTEPTPVKPAPVKPTTPTTPVNAAGSVQFSKIVYNPAGKDTGTNASRNAEYVRITNKTKKTINIKGWTVRDAAGHVYTFRSSYHLAAGGNAYVLTGSGTDSKPVLSYRYWGSKGYVWNNGGDTAYLRDATNKAIDSCRWTKDKGTTYC